MHTHKHTHTYTHTYTHTHKHTHTHTHTHTHGGLGHAPFENFHIVNIKIKQYGGILLTLFALFEHFLNMLNEDSLEVMYFEQQKLFYFQ